MKDSTEPRSGQVRLPGFVEPVTADGLVPVPELARPGPDPRAGRARDEGVRRVRRISNWTAAALVVGTGAAAVALAHNAVPIAPPSAPGVPVPGAGTTGTTGTTATGSAHGPQVGHSVATTSASGVTTTTTTLPNGKTVVTHSGHSTYHDN